jgi:hypothetical protein
MDKTGKFRCLICAAIAEKSYEKEDEIKDCEDCGTRGCMFIIKKQNKIINIYKKTINFLRRNERD